MRIGILTFHYSCNYGGVLQAYALQKTIEALGHSTKIINYIPDSYKHTLSSYLLRPISIENIKKALIKLFKSYKLKLAFDQFRSEYLNLTANVEDLSTINNDFDLLITGSDQVWNYNQHDKHIYFLDWEPRFLGKRISYAVCCAINRIDYKNRNTLISALKNFDNISVRNKETWNFVNDLLNINPIVTSDPTMLYDFNEFVTNINKSYILTYLIGKEIQDGHKKAIKNLKNKYPNRKVISIVSAYDNPQVINWADKVIYSASPIEWVDLIANADCVYTDSFHGVIFSIKFNRDFVCYYSEEHRKSRFVDMSERYGIASHIVSNGDMIDNSSINDFKTSEMTKSIFKEQISTSIQFLKNNLI